MEKKQLVPFTITGIGGVLNAYLSLENLLDYTSSRAAILQSELARAPELTEQVYENAREAMDMAGQGDLYAGFAFALAAGVCAVNAVGYALKKEE